MRKNSCGGGGFLPMLSIAKLATGTGGRMKTRIRDLLKEQFPTVDGSLTTNSLLFIFAEIT